MTKEMKKLLEDDPERIFKISIEKKFRESDWKFNKSIPVCPKYDMDKAEDFYKDFIRAVIFNTIGNGLSFRLVVHKERIQNPVGIQYPSKNLVYYSLNFGDLRWPKDSIGIAAELLKSIRSSLWKSYRGDNDYPDSLLETDRAINRAIDVCFHQGYKEELRVRKILDSAVEKWIKEYDENESMTLFPDPAPSSKPSKPVSPMKTAKGGKKNGANV